MIGAVAPGVTFAAARSEGSISPVRMDVAAFVGIAQRGPLGIPVVVESWREFAGQFGGFFPSGFLAYAIRGFFENGGRRCWIVRVASRRQPAMPAQADPMRARDPTAPPGAARAVWSIRASSAGEWGNRLSVTVRETHHVQDQGRSVPSAPDTLAVGTAGEFTRGTLVRLSQAGRPPLDRVVAAVDARRGRLIFRTAPPGRPLRYERGLEELDQLIPTNVESIEYTVVVRDGGIPIRVYDGLSLLPEHPRYGPAVCPEANGSSTAAAAVEPIAIVEEREDYRLVGRASLGAPLRIDVLDASETTLALAGGRDGLESLAADDFLDGLAALEEIREPGAIAVPDVHVRASELHPTAPLPPCMVDLCCGTAPEAPAPPPAPGLADRPPRFGEEQIGRVQAAMVEQCERRRDRVALLEPPFDLAHGGRFGVGAVRGWRRRFESRYAACYHPWVRVPDPLQEANGTLVRDIPPCGHVAGQFAMTDFTAGVHRAPANQPLAWIQDVTASVDEASHGLLNDEGVNVLRSYPGRGVRIMGARTLSSDPDWVFLNVRRLLIMVEKAIDQATQWAVFEPNNDLTRSKLRLALTSYLLALWGTGALTGRRAAEAFQVICDASNNGAGGRADGRLVADVLVAPIAPMEFIRLRIWRAGNELEVTETGPGVRL